MRQNRKCANPATASALQAPLLRASRARASFVHYAPFGRSYRGGVAYASRLASCLICDRYRYGSMRLQAIESGGFFWLRGPIV